MAPANPHSHSMQRTSSIRVIRQTGYVARSANTPIRQYVNRVMSSEVRRLRYVRSGLSQLEAYARSSNRLELDTSAIQLHDFVAESSDETPFERFLVWNPVEDPNVVYARPAIAEAIRRYAAAVALNALPKSDEGEDNATEDGRGDRKDSAGKRETDDGGSDSDGDGDDENIGGIQIGGR